MPFTGVGHANTQTDPADTPARPDIEIDRAVNDFGSTALGTAYQWIMQAYPIDMVYVRARLIRDYGAPSPR